MIEEDGLSVRRNSVRESLCQLHGPKSQRDDGPSVRWLYWHCGGLHTPLVIDALRFAPISLARKVVTNA